MLQSMSCCSLPCTSIVYISVGQASNTNISRSGCRKLSIISLWFLICASTMRCRLYSVHVCSSKSSMLSTIPPSSSIGSLGNQLCTSVRPCSQLFISPHTLHLIRGKSGLYSDGWKGIPFLSLAIKPLLMLQK